MKMKGSEQDGVYSPAEDTFLLAAAVKTYVADKVLEIGIGSGLVVSELVERSRLAVGVDIDVEVVRKVEEAFKWGWSKVNLVCCDSASPFREGVFDLVVFNPPYLPSDGTVDRAVDGGRGGVEVSKRWFSEAARCLEEEGRIMFVTSSLSDVEELFEYVESLGFKVEVLSKTHLFFEDISVVKARRVSVKKHVSPQHPDFPT